VELAFPPGEQSQSGRGIAMLEQLQGTSARSATTLEPSSLVKTRVGPPRKRILPSIEGKFLNVNGSRFWVKAVTYGTFAANSAGEPYPEMEQVRDDFARMADAGINTVRLYTPPSDRIADAAADAGLMLIPDICWGSRKCELQQPKLQGIYDYAREHARRLARHPALLMYSIGNETPPLIVRWYGRKKVEEHVRKLYDIVKEEAPQSLVTYANHPPAEHLNLGFLDVVSFNVYLDHESDFRKYLGRLQSIAGERPLMISELGLDSGEHGEKEQARFLAGHLRAVFEKGLCGAAVYAWTDEWSIFQEKIEGWSFGLTRNDRSPKPALRAVQKIFSRDIYGLRDTAWPRVSVVVCSYNGGTTLPGCLESLERLNYPNYEVIVIDDGSKDDTPQIVKRFDCRSIRVPNGGLSRARNLGIQNATGEIVAFIDSDAYADADWLFYLVTALEEHDAGAVGGPNLAVPSDSFTSHCIDQVPGNPTHVLLTDETAEHVPGCNMAFRKSALSEIGNFDPTHRAAGDDVDVCWKLLIQNHQIAFAPSGVVWHHRRPTAMKFLRQQQGYGYAEAFLQRRYPSRFNAFGNLVWQGSVYDGAHVTMRREGLPALFPPRVYQGRFCSAGYQSVHQPFLTWWFQIFTKAEWQGTAACVILAATGSGWTGNTWSAIVLGLLGIAMTLFTLGGAALAGAHAVKARKWTGRERMRGFLLVAALNILQPLWRAKGRIIGIWRSREDQHEFPEVKRLWGNLSQRDRWLNHMQVHLKAAGWVVEVSGDWGTTDLEILGPGPCAASLTSVYEDVLERGRHYVCYRVTARRKMRPILSGLAILAALAALIFLRPDLAPLALPVAVYVTMLWRARTNTLRAVSQLATECGKPFGMTPVEDEV
jgi:GT2 family glycosyltransferase